MKFVKENKWLLQKLFDPNTRIIDCRFSLGNPHAGQQAYEIGHIPGAVFFDLEKDLSAPVGPHGGRHPLPNIEELVTKLERAGISQETTLIAYDDGEGAFTARFWWLLSYLGQKHVYVLDGGFRHWVQAQLPVTAEVPSFEKAVFDIQLDPTMLATMEDVRAVSKGEAHDVVLVDSREEKRYLGLEEPIDKKKGHIPGAINKPWMEGLSGGQYLAAAEQERRFTEIGKNQEVIVYCGSGVTAAPNVLALKEAGYERVKMYVGSFSDWISYEENEINTSR